METLVYTGPRYTLRLPHSPRERQSLWQDEGTIRGDSCKRLLIFIEHKFFISSTVDTCPESSYLLSFLLSTIQGAKLLQRVSYPSEGLSDRTDETDKISNLVRFLIPRFDIHQSLNRQF
ncbi:hypothetical protein ACTXT7_003561 [Hymenolepis weldensis]